MTTASLRFSPFSEPPSYYVQMPDEAVLLPQENEVSSITVLGANNESYYASSKKMWLCAMAISAALVSGGIYIAVPYLHDTRSTGLFEHCVLIQHPDICDTAAYPYGRKCGIMADFSDKFYYMYVDTVNAAQMQDIKSHAINPRCNMFQETRNSPSTSSLIMGGLGFLTSAVGVMGLWIGLMDKYNTQQAFG